MPCRSQPYAGEADLEAMIALLRAVRSPARLADFPSPNDLRELLAEASVRDQTRLWRDPAGRLAAFALLDARYCNIYFALDPAAQAEQIAAEMFTWGAAAMQAANGPAAVLDTSSRDDDSLRLDLLARHGFVPQEMHTGAFERDLQVPVPQPVLPPGFTIRPLDGRAEVRAAVALHRAAFATDHMTLDERLAIMGVPDYDPALDLVVVAPDGRLAAFCIGAIYESENRLTGRNVGYTDPIGTHPDFQRRGLARAVLLHALTLLRQRGMELAALSTRSDNTAMQALAVSAGFRLAYRKQWFTRPAVPSASQP